MSIWIPLVVYLSIQSITPGPNNLTCLYLGASGGIRATKKFLIASMLALFVKALLCGVLNRILAEYMPTVSAWLKWIGAAYMVYLAYTMARSGWRAETSAEKRGESTYRAGIILQLLNTKSWIASISAFAVYVIPLTDSMKAVVLVSVVFLILATVASLIWALFGSSLRGVISRYRKPFGIVMGAALLWCAISAVL